MATIYCSHTGSNTAPYDTKAKAAKTLAAAIAAMTAAGDVILVDHTHTGDNALASDTSYILNYSCAIIAIDFSTDALAEMGTSAWIGHSSSNRWVRFTGAGNATHFLRGLTLRETGGDNIEVNYGADSHMAVEACYFWLGGSYASSVIRLGAGSTTPATTTIARNCTFRFDDVDGRIEVGGIVKMFGCSLAAESVAITALLDLSGVGGALYAEGCDFSDMGSGYLIDALNALSLSVTLVNCKLGSGFVPLASQTGFAPELYLYNCNAGDVHYFFGHYDPLGSCVAYTSIHANDGPTYDGATEFAWRIDTTARATLYNPYISPWVSTYHDGTSAITPRLEILRDGSSTAFDDDEVWGEFSYQGTSGYPISTIVNDRVTLLGTPAAQATGMGTGSWTGESGTAWSGKLAPASSITPAEIGELRARVCVGLASATVYVDPQIRIS